MEPSISIVVPVYNGSQHLPAFFNALSMQEKTDFELIVVNAGSTDDSGSLLPKYMQPYPNARLIHLKERALPGEARNAGVVVAQSPYIVFWDIDDIPTPDMLSQMYAAAQQNQADIVVCDYDIVYPDRTQSCFSGIASGDYPVDSGNMVDYYCRFAAAPHPNNSACTRLYKAAFLKASGVVFYNTSFSEDHLFNTMLLTHCPHIAHVGRAFYRYIQHPRSSTRQYTDLAPRFYQPVAILAKYLESFSCEGGQGIMALYAYTRLRSIVFYARRMQLSEVEIGENILWYVDQPFIRDSLNRFINDGYLTQYLETHAIEPRLAQPLAQALASCAASQPFNLDAII